jgi:hypothetical protein
MTNREAHEEASGMGLEDSFFRMNGIDPDAEYIEGQTVRGQLEDMEIGDCINTKPNKDGTYNINKMKNREKESQNE